MTKPNREEEKNISRNEFSQSCPFFEIRSFLIFFLIFSVQRFYKFKNLNNIFFLLSNIRSFHFLIPYRMTDELDHRPYAWFFC